MNDEKNLTAIEEDSDTAVESPDMEEKNGQPEEHISSQNDESENEASEMEENISEKAAEQNEREAILALKNELAELRQRLEAEKALYGRLYAESSEFSELFPGVTLSAIPESVWECAKKGAPLSAAYALYEKRLAIAKEKAEDVNSKNKELSSGSLSSTKNEEYFTPDEVRAMSAAQVKANYSKIINSMSVWH